MAQQRILAAVVTALLWTATAAAHHPFSDEFDRTKTVTLTGTVSKIEWQNPHAYVYLDVKDTNGSIDDWKVEMGSPAALTKEGWTRTAVKNGDRVTVQGWRAKSEGSVANASTFVLANGKKMAAASSFNMVPEEQLAQNAPAEQQPVGTTGSDTERLPATASPLALYAALGALALAGALGLRAFRS
jgi:hypothetical protein